MWTMVLLFAGRKRNCVDWQHKVYTSHRDVFIDRIVINLKGKGKQSPVESQSNYIRATIEVVKNLSVGIGEKSYYKIRHMLS
jgi:hypothetical protein